MAAACGEASDAEHPNSSLSTQSSVSPLLDKATQARPETSVDDFSLDADTTLISSHHRTSVRAQIYLPFIISPTLAIYSR